MINNCPEKQLIIEDLFDNVVDMYSNDKKYPFPTTRYQGSKNKISKWIWDKLKNIQFNVVLDAFGGTACVSHLLKRKNKQVIYNDILKFNHIIGKALIENSSITLSSSDIDFILSNHGYKYPKFIQATFKDVFYTDDENIWLDMVITNIDRMEDEYKKALALFALFQSCIAKRPYNLFHRANLYLRTTDVKRSFGNKTTWDKSFNEHFIKFVEEANNAVFDNKKECKSLNADVSNLDCIQNIDLVYIDPPYISSKGSKTDYLDFYHFLEGICNYDEWSGFINFKYKHLPIRKNVENPWCDKKLIYNEFDKIFEKYKDSTLVVSYRLDGTPSIDELVSMLRKYKRTVKYHISEDYKYVLSNCPTNEVLIIAE